tara:strand:- start:19050 stop:19853 length:804 start_codon:yes stop_codon:yes gene_type:complete
LALGLTECSGKTLEEVIKLELNKKGIKTGTGTNKYARYANSSALPLSKTLQQVDLVAPGTSFIVDMPLWQALKPGSLKEEFFNNFYKQLSPRFHRLFYYEGPYGPIRKEYKPKNTRSLLESFSLEALATLIVLYREQQTLKKTGAQSRPIKSAIQCLLFYLSMTSSLYYFRQALFDYITQELKIFSEDDALTRRLRSLNIDEDNETNKAYDAIAQYRSFMSQPEWFNKDAELKLHVIEQYNRCHPSNYKPPHIRQKERFPDINIDEL